MGRAGIRVKLRVKLRDRAYLWHRPGSKEAQNRSTLPPRVRERVRVKFRGRITGKVRERERTTVRLRVKKSQNRSTLPPIRGWGHD
jgi:hypothetical protein